MPLPHPNWQQQEQYSNQHKQPRQYQPSSREHQHDRHQSRERSRKTTRSGGKKERYPSQREIDASAPAEGTSQTRRQRRNGSYPDLARLPPPDFRSLPHTHADVNRQQGREHRHREKEQHHQATKGRSSTGAMRRSRTTSMSTPMEGVSRHIQTSTAVAEDESQGRRYHPPHHTTHPYPTIPGDRVRFDTLEPGASKLHQQLQHELKSELGGRRRSRSVSLTSRERSLERNVRKERHQQHRKKDREPTSTADRPISPPAQFSLPSTTYAAISSRPVIDTSAGRKFETQYSANQRLPPSQISRTIDTKVKGQKASRPSHHHLAHASSQIVPLSKPPIASTKPSLQERYSTSFSSHQIPPPLPPQGSSVMQHKAKYRAKDKTIKDAEEEVGSHLVTDRRQLEHTHEHFDPTLEGSLKHVCGIETESLQFQTEPEESRSKVPVALKPTRISKQRHEVLPEFHGAVQRNAASEPRPSESDSYMIEEKHQGLRGRDKSKQIMLPATDGESPQQFAQSYERQKPGAKSQLDEEAPSKEHGRDDRSKRRQKSKTMDDEEAIRRQIAVEEEQKIKREREDRDNRITRRILEKQKEAKAINEKIKLDQEFERDRLTAEMREKERIAKEMANQERKAIEKAERDKREKMKQITKLQQERDEERRSQRSRIGRQSIDGRLTRRLSKDILTTTPSDTTYVKGEYVDNIDLVSETSRLLMPPEDDLKRERSWDRKSRKSYDSAPPMEDARSGITTFDDSITRPSTMPDTKRPQSESHKHKVIVHSKEHPTRSGRIDEVFANGIITHDRPSHLDESDATSTRPISLISLLPPPLEGDHGNKSTTKEASQRRKRSMSPPCVCAHENGGTPPESDSGNQETVLEVPVPSHEFQRPLTPTQVYADDVEPSMHWDRRSRDSKGSRATKTSHSARSQGYASLASSVFVGEKTVSKAEALYSRSGTYGMEDEMRYSPVESVDLCITTDDHQSMITPSVLGDVITTDDGRGSPVLTQYRPRSHSKSRHHKSSSNGRDRHVSSGHRDHPQQQHRSHVSHQATPKSQHRHYKSHHPEGSDLGYDSRCDMYGLESDYEIEQHIRNCRCPCDHLGHGNYLDYQVRIWLPFVFIYQERYLSSK